MIDQDRAMSGRKRHADFTTGCSGRGGNPRGSRGDDKSRVGWLGADRALSRPGDQDSRSELRQISHRETTVERLYTGARWSEGPVWFGDARCVLWSDIPNNRILKWDEETGRTSVYRKPSNFSNGNTRDRQGRLVTCEHDTRRVTRTGYDGSITVLVDKFDGKPLNSPNDVVVKSDDSIWFTDPPFGILGNYEGHVASPEL